MATTAQSTLHKSYQETPKAVQKLLVSDIYGDTIESIARNYGVRERAALENEITLLLLGLRDPDTFDERLSEELEFDVETAREIMNDIDDSLFIPFLSDEELGLQILSDLETAKVADEPREQERTSISREDARKALLEDVSSGSTQTQQKTPLASTPDLSGKQSNANSVPEKKEQGGGSPIPTKNNTAQPPTKTETGSETNKKADGDRKTPAQKGVVDEKRVPVKESSQEEQKSGANKVLGGDLISSDTEKDHNANTKTPKESQPSTQDDSPQKKSETGADSTEQVADTPEKKEQKIPYKVEESRGPTTDLEGIEITQQPRDGGYESATSSDNYSEDDRRDEGTPASEEADDFKSLNRDDVLAQIEDLDKSERGDHQPPSQGEMAQPYNEKQTHEDKPQATKPPIPQKKDQDTGDRSSEKEYNEGGDPYREPIE